MSIRTINYTVTADSITPATLQRGGLQGEHNATELIFNIENSLAEKLGAAAGYIPIEDGAIEGELYYRFEGHTCMGMKNSTLPVRFEIPESEIKEFSLNYSLENWLTREGGNITVYLIFSVLSDNETHIDIFSYPAKLKLEAVPEGKYTDGKNYESVAKLSVAATEAAERAEEAAEISEAAKEQTANARFALENGAEFIFMGGDAFGAAEIDFVVDNELSEYSSNPISNQAVAEQLNKFPTKEENKNTFENYVDKETYSEDKKTADDERAEIKESFETIADYITETGKIGIWNYEKRASGICKLWGKTIATTSITQSFGGIYRSTETFSEEFPFEFEEPPVCNSELSSSGDWAIFKILSFSSTINRTSILRAGRPTSDGTAVPLVIHWEVIGKLKTEE